MHTTKRARRALVVLTAVIGSMLAIGAGPAMASLHWSDSTHGIKVAGTLSVANNGSKKSCTPSAKQEVPLMEGAFAYIQTDPEWGQLKFSCGGVDPFGMYFMLQGTSTTSVKVGMESLGAVLYNPWGGFYTQGAPMVGDFTNGSGATSSTLAFASDEVGRNASNQPITLTGSLKVTTSSGGLLTLQN